MKTVITITINETRNNTTIEINIAGTKSTMKLVGALELAKEQIIRGGRKNDRK